MPTELSMRRSFIKKAAIIAGGALIVSPLLFAKSLLNSEEKEEEVSPNDDLMREHGVLRRIILIYREAIHRVQDKQDLDPVLITKSANLIRHFIEDYHEKLEENFLFPRFEKAGQLTDLVATLKNQHLAGRKITNHILEISAHKQFKSHAKDFIDVLSQFIRIY